MPTPFNVQGKLIFPGAPGLPPDALPYGFAEQYDSRASFEYLFPDAVGTQVVDFGTMPAEGAKVVLLTYEQDPDDVLTPTVITVAHNAGTHPIELSPGGFICIGSPAPAAGITSLLISYTSLGKVRVWLLG